MGSPELPDLGEEDLRPIEPIQHAPLSSEESDNESVGIYDGYQPLAIDEFAEESNNTINNFAQEIEDVEPAQNLPGIERLEIELERQVWNAPRPQENQIELDTTKTAQILSAMANFTLPTLPDWVTDEHWKEELLQRIRQRRNAEQSDPQQAEDKNE